jgi:formylglycine-generating enzyme required for sulfatase activity
MLGSNFLYEAQSRMSDAAQQAWARYLSGNRHPSFTGWYLPYEPWTADYSTAEVNRLRSFFQGVRQACQLVSGEFPLAISPFINSTRPPPCDVERVYAQLLDQSGIGIVMLQDSVGAQQWESNIVQRVSPYAQAFQSACAVNGVELWANLECFKIEGATYVPCSASRLQKQFEATAPFVQHFVTFDFVHYMNPVAFLSSWGQERRDRMQQLFRDYKAAFVDQDYAPWGSPLISTTATSGDLTLGWPGAPGDQFQVQWRTNLADAAWTPLTANIQTNGPGFSVVEEVVAQQQARFFRVQRLPKLQPLEDMVWIPPGTFRMGTPTNDPNVTPNELPQFIVTLTRGFWLSRFEVTQSDYQNLMCINPGGFTGNLNRPVERASWDDAMEYCSRLTQRERQAGRLPGTHVYRLPSEAEWEYAARAGTTTWFSFGNDSSLLGSYAWYNGNSGATTHPIGERMPNPWGLNDIHGNVFEWCWDWIVTAPSEPTPDFVGSTNGAYHAIRGGAWSFPAAYCRSSWRIGYSPDARTSNVGFRIVLAAVAP